MLKARVITSVISLVLIGVVLFALPLQVAEWLIGLLLVVGAWEWSGFLGLSSSVKKAAYTAIFRPASPLCILYYRRKQR